MYKLAVSELAHRDLDSIVSYIACELVNPDAAGDFLDEVSACYRNLKNNPMMYEKCRDNQYTALFLRRAGLYKTDIAKSILNIRSISATRCFFYALY